MRLTCKVAYFFFSAFPKTPVIKMCGKTKENRSSIYKFRFSDSRLSRVLLHDCTFESRIADFPSAISIYCNLLISRLAPWGLNGERRHLTSELMSLLSASIFPLEFRFLRFLDMRNMLPQTNAGIMQTANNINDK